MPKNQKKHNPIDDITENDVLVADDYHEQKQKEDDFETQNDLLDYLKNNGRQVFEAQKIKAEEESRKNGQPFDLDYTEKGVMLCPFPCEITKNKNGVEIPQIANPFDLNNPDKDIALVCFSQDRRPLYENDKKTLKIVKSTDPEFQALDADYENAPEEVKMMNDQMKSIVEKWEKKHPVTKPETVTTLDYNQVALLKIASFVKIAKNIFDHKLSEQEKKWWEKYAKLTNLDEKTKSLLLHYDVNPVENKDLMNNFIKVINKAIKNNVFDLKNIKIESSKTR